MYTERKEMVCDRRNERVVRGGEEGDRNTEELLEGTFAGAFLIGTNRGRSSRRLSNIGSSAATLNISPFRVKLHALFQSLPLSLSPPTRSSLSRLVYRLLLAPSEKQYARQWRRYVFAPFSSPPPFVFFELAPPL